MRLVRHAMLIVALASLVGCSRVYIVLSVAGDNATAPEIIKIQWKSPDQVKVHEQVTEDAHVIKRDTTDEFTPTQEKSQSLELRVK